MEVVLIDNARFDAERGFVGETLIKVNVNVAELNSRCVRGNPAATEEYRKKIVSASTDYLKRTGRSLCIHIKKTPENPEDVNKCLVRVHGFLWQNVDPLLLNGVRVRLQLRFFYAWVIAPTNPVVCIAELPLIPAYVNALGGCGCFKIDKNEICLKNEGFIEAANIMFNRDDLSQHICANFFVFVTISLVSDSQDCAILDSDKLQVLNTDEIAITRICRDILHLKIHSDVIMVASDGTDFPCNKSFLAAHSPVFADMLKKDTKSSETGKIKLEDVTAEGVKALLEYMYTCDLDTAMEDCAVAFQLLQVSDKYGMELLTKKISSILVKKGVDWFNIDVAFGLFLVSRKVESMKEIKIKSASVLIAKLEEFMECKSYKKELEDNPVQAANAVSELLLLLSRSKE